MIYQFLLFFFFYFLPLDVKIKRKEHSRALNENDRIDKHLWPSTTRAKLKRVKQGYGSIHAT